MNLDSIYIALPTKSPAEIQQWWATFKQVNPKGDNEAFFQWLFEQKHITDLQYWDALNGADMSLFAETDLEVGPETEEGKPPATPEDAYQFIAELGAGAMGEVHIVKEGIPPEKSGVEVHSY